MHTEQVQGGVVLLEAMGLGVVLLIGCEWTGLGAWTLLGRSKQERSIYENTRLRGDLERCALHPRTISCREEWLWQGLSYYDARDLVRRTPCVFGISDPRREMSFRLIVDVVVQPRSIWQRA